MKIQHAFDERELHLKVTLSGARPPIWRRLVVRERMSVSDVHRAVQAAMGWLDCHLYEFSVRGVRYTTSDLDAPDDGYLELLQVVGDPTHPDHAERRDWLPVHFDPDHFDIDEVNDLLQQPNSR